jgi:hypothetical protein
MLWAVLPCEQSLLLPGSGSTVNPEGFWITSTFDRLGRVTETTMPRGDDKNALTTSVKTSFDGVSRL